MRQQSDPSLEERPTELIVVFRPVENAGRSFFEQRTGNGLGQLSPLPLNFVHVQVFDFEIEKQVRELQPEISTQEHVVQGKHLSGEDLDLGGHEHSPLPPTVWQSRQGAGLHLCEAQERLERWPQESQCLTEAGQSAPGAVKSTKYCRRTVETTL